MSDFKLFETWYHENFSSSLLAFAMRQSQDFSKRVMKLVADKAGQVWGEIVIHGVEREFPIEGPGYGSRRRVDLCVEAEVDGKSLLCLIEAKIESGEQQRQLTDDRCWLEAQPADIKILATLSKHRLVWSAKPDVELRWADLTPLVAEMKKLATAESFEDNFWSQFREHLEDVMATFEGFSSGPTDVHKLMQEIELFLLSVFEKIGVTKFYENWRQNRAAYWLPQEEATVGFYWWEKWRDPSRENTLLVLRQKPEQRKIAIATLQEIVTQCAAAKRDGVLDGYVAKIGAEVQKALEPTK